MLAGFEDMFDVDRDALRKVINQKVTSPDPTFAQLTTPIITTKDSFTTGQTTSISPNLFVDVIKYDKEDYYDPSLWPELEKTFKLTNSLSREILLRL